MMVIVVEGVPSRLRGRLAVWLLEVRAGVYVGNISSKQRKVLWEQVCQQVLAEGGNAVIVHAVDCEQGYAFDTCGVNRRIPIEVDGFHLIRFLPDEEKNV